MGRPADGLPRAFGRVFRSSAGKTFGGDERVEVGIVPLRTPARAKRLLKRIAEHYMNALFRASADLAMSFTESEKFFTASRL